MVRSIFIQCLQKIDEEKEDDDIIKYFKDNFRYSKLINIASIFESKNQFLEGTGSMVLDRKNKIIYAAKSERTHKIRYFILVKK